MKQSLSKIGGNFARRGANMDLDDVASIAGYNFAALGTYWRSNTLAGFAQMKRGEMQESMETFNLAVSTLAVWDLGQGVAYPIADKLINKVILKYQDDFQRTLNAFKDYRNVMKTNVLDDATKATDASVLKGKLVNSKGDIAKAFQLDVESGLSRFKNTQIYGDLVTDLKGIKTWTKAAKWADVFAGPLFDAATVAVSAWQLSEAIKNNDPFAIASSSLGLASGLAGLTGFAVAALATAGTTLAAVAGPVGAIIGAILGIASIIVEIIATLNPYTKIDKDLSMLNELRDASKKYLDADFENLQKLIPSQANFSFSWVYELNQGHLIDLVTGRAREHQRPVEFRLDKTGKMENGYMVVGKKKQFDKRKYPNNFFWNPSGIVDLGYDFYGKKITPELKGATVIVSTELVSGKGAELRGVDVQTFQSAEDAMPDSVVLDDLYDMALWSTLKVETGGGNDVIVMNGLIGKPGHIDYPGHKGYKWGYGDKIRIKTTVDSSVDAKTRENNILSFEGMSKKNNHGLLGVYFEMTGGSLYYISEKEGSKKKYNFGEVTGIKMFIGTPFNDAVAFSMDYDYVIRQTKGTNEYILSTTSWGPFSITIDDQCEEPGKLKIEKAHHFVGLVKKKHLVYSEGTKTLFIYARQRNARWQVRGKIFFNRRREGYPLIETEADGEVTRLNELPDEFEPKEETEDIGSIVKELDYQYRFDRNLEGSCAHYKIFLNPPDFKRGRYYINFRMRKNTLNDMILKTDFVNKCLKKAKRSFHLICTDRIQRQWMIRLFAPDGLDNNECPGKDYEIQTNYIPFARVLEELEGGKMRLLVDLRTEKRDSINIVKEMKKMDDQKKFQFSEDIEGNIGIPQAVELEPPAEVDPADGVIRSSIDLKGGERRNEDSLVFTDGLRKWLTENERKIKLIKEGEGHWNMRIEKSTSGDLTHEVRLVNIESIVYEPSDVQLRVLVIPNLATEADDNIDLEDETKKREQRARRPLYENRFNDCRYYE
eukprot:gene10819-biopygen8649